MSARIALDVSVLSSIRSALRAARFTHIVLYLYVLALCLCALSGSAEFMYPSFASFMIVCLPLIGLALAWQAIPIVPLVAIGLFSLGTLIRWGAAKPRAVVSELRFMLLIVITFATTLTISRADLPRRLGFMLHRGAFEDVLRRQRPRIEGPEKIGLYRVDSCWEGEGGAAFFQLAADWDFAALWNDRRGFAHLPNGCSAWWRASVRNPTHVSGDWYFVMLDEDELRRSPGPASVGSQ